MIYLDNAATTRPLEIALNRFLEISRESFGNSSSGHGFGYKASKILEDSRKNILSYLGLSKTHGLVFTSGATEANNLAIRGCASHYKNRGKRIITTSIEHESVLNVFKALEREQGFELVLVNPRSDGTIDPKDVEEAMDKSTILVSVMAVNNETGAINDIASIADIVHRFPKAFFHSDITQAIGKMKLPYGKIDMMSFSGHKIGAVKGIGSLIYKKSIQFDKVLEGGEQEFEYRPGTVDVPSIASMDAALKYCLDNLDEHHRRVKEVRDLIYHELENSDEILLNSNLECLPYVISLSLRKKKASVVVEALSEKGIYVGTTSACSSKLHSSSHVLLAMGKDEGEASNPLRLSFSMDTGIEEARIFLNALNSILKEVHDR